MDDEKLSFTFITVNQFFLKKKKKCRYSKHYTCIHTCAHSIRKFKKQDQSFSHIHTYGAPAVRIGGGGGGAATALSGNAAGELTLLIGAAGSAGFLVLCRIAPVSP